MSYLQKLEQANIRLSYQVINRTASLLNMTPEELKQRIAFMYHWALKNNQKCQFDSIVEQYSQTYLVVPLGYLQYFCLFHQRSGGWVLIYVGREDGIRAKTNYQNKLVDSNANNCAQEEYNKDLFSFAYMNQNTPKNALPWLAIENLSADQLRLRVLEAFRISWQKGDILEESETELSFSFSITSADTEILCKAIMHPNRNYDANQSLQRWTLDRIYRVSDSDAVPPHPPKDDQSRDKPKVFIGFGFDPLTNQPPDSVNVIREKLETLGLEPVVLGDRMRGIQSIATRLIEMLGECIYAFFVFSPHIKAMHEEIRNRAFTQSQVHYAKQNVMYETGLAVGMLSVDRVTVLVERLGEHIPEFPSDIDSSWRIEIRGDDNLRNTVEDVLRKARIIH